MSSKSADRDDNPNLGAKTSKAAKARAQIWLEENREAIEWSNAYVEKHGLPLARYRQF